MNKEKVKINIYDSKKHDVKFFTKYNEDQYQLNFLEYKISKEMDLKQFKRDLQDVKIIVVFVNDDVSKEIITILKENNIKLITTRSAGFNHIDLKAAKANDIKVARVPKYSPHSIAEHAIALLLTINRKTHRAYLKSKMNDFTLDGLIGWDLYGQTIGVFGYGKIGKIFANIMKSFGCNVIINSLPSDQELIIKDGFEFVDLKTLLQKSDILSLHSPLTPDTEEIINKKTIAIMKKGIVLINTSRGGLINSADLIEGLRKNIISFVGLDVYSNEANYFFEDKSKDNINDPILMQLLQSNKVLITPHSAFFTHNALTEIAKVTLFNIKQFLNNQPLDNGL